MTERQRRWQALELLYAHRPAEPGTIPAFVDLLGYTPHEHEEDLWRGTLHRLNGDGLIRLTTHLTFEGASAVLTDAGRTAGEERMARRDDPAARWNAALNGVMRWVYEQSSEGPEWVQTVQVLTTDHAVFEGTPLPETVVLRAAAQLHDDGLIDAGKAPPEAAGPLVIRITRSGRQCVEAGRGVDEFLRQQHQPQPTISNIFNAPISGSNVAAGSTDVTQTLSSSGLAGDDLKVLLNAIREALPVLNLPIDQAATVTRSVDVVEAELEQEDPDTGVVKTMMQRAVRGLGSAAQGALGTALTLLTKYEMARMGIPVE